MSSAPPILYLQDIHLTYGVTPLLEGADLSVGRGARLELISVTKLCFELDCSWLSALVLCFFVMSVN